jgi:uncharacterized membrane protein SirB2
VDADVVVSRFGGFSFFHYLPTSKIGNSNSQQGLVPKILYSDLNKMVIWIVIAPMMFKQSPMQSKKVIMFYVNVSRITAEEEI